MERKDPKLPNDGKLHLKKLKKHFFIPSLDDLKNLNLAVGDQNQQPADQKDIDAALDQLFAHAEIVPETTLNIKNMMDQSHQLKTKQDPSSKFADLKTCKEFREAHPNTSLFTMTGELKDEVTLVPGNSNVRRDISNFVKRILGLCLSIIHDSAGNLQPWIFEYYKEVGRDELLQQLINKSGLPYVREHLITAVVMRISCAIRDCSKDLVSADLGVTLVQLIRHQWQVNRSFGKKLREAQKHLKKINYHREELMEPAESHASFLRTHPCLDAGKFLPLVDLGLQAHEGKDFITDSQNYAELKANVNNWLMLLLTQEQPLDQDFKREMAQTSDLNLKVKYVMLWNHLNYLVNSFPKASEESKLSKVEYDNRKDLARNDSIWTMHVNLEQSIALLDMFDIGLKEFQLQLLRLQANSDLNQIEGLDELNTALRESLSKFKEVDDNDEAYLFCFRHIPLLQLIGAINQLPKDEREHYLKPLELIIKSFNKARENDELFVSIDIDFVNAPIKALLELVKIPVRAPLESKQSAPASELKDPVKESKQMVSSSDVQKELAMQLARLSAFNCLLETTKENSEIAHLKPLLIDLNWLLVKDPAEVLWQLNSVFNGIANLSRGEYAEVVGVEVNKDKGALLIGINQAIDLMPDDNYIVLNIKLYFLRVLLYKLLRKKHPDVMQRVQDDYQKIMDLKIDNPITLFKYLNHYKTICYSFKQAAQFKNANLKTAAMDYYISFYNKKCQSKLSEEEVVKNTQELEANMAVFATLDKYYTQAEGFKNESLRNDAYKYLYVEHLQPLLNSKPYFEAGPLVVNERAIVSIFLDYIKLNALPIEIEKLEFDKDLQNDANKYFDDMRICGTYVLQKQDIDSKIALLRNLNELRGKMNSTQAARQGREAKAGDVDMDITVLGRAFLPALCEGACIELKALFKKPDPEREKHVLQVLSSINTGAELVKIGPSLEALKTSRNGCQLFLAAVMGLLGLALIGVGAALLIQTGFASYTVSQYLITVGTKWTMVGAGALAALGSYLVFPSTESSFVKNAKAILFKYNEKKGTHPAESKRGTQMLLPMSP